MGIENDPTIGQLISDFGFPIVMAVGMGYFVYFVYQTILRLLDQDMIRLQEKVNTVLEMKENEKKLDNISTTTDDNNK